ncbi:MAG: hypothetical protein ABIU11_07080 [Chitinophagaceae bacterium]
MKKIILLMTMVFLIVSSYCQTKTSSKFSEKYYLQKAKSQKTIGWILLGGGIAVFTTGVLIGKESDEFDLGGRATATILEITGAASILGSMIFFTSAAKKKDWRLL